MSPSEMKPVASPAASFAIHDWRRADLAFDEHTHYIEHRRAFGHHEHIGLHNRCEHALLLLLIQVDLRFRIAVLHEDEHKDESDSAEHRRNPECGIHAVHAGKRRGFDCHERDRHHREHRGEDSGSQRARDLAEGVVHRGTMVDQVVRQRVHRPGGDGHVDERHAKKADSHDNRHVDKAHFRP